MTKAKPFIKWVGGKGQLIEQLERHLPADFDNWTDVTYIEPFVGGGAMLFYMLQTYPNIKNAVINDINADLTSCYRTIKKTPEKLILSLKEIEDEYLNIPNQEARKSFYLEVRDKYNSNIDDPIKNSTLFIFLNRTCYNGLYRVNKSGKFNVPFGKYANPTICDATTIMKDSELLQSVEIITGDFEQTFEYASTNTFFYFDPPYRPLSNTSSFTDYSKEPFNDDAQIRLRNYCNKLDDAGYKFMLSNSDGKGKNEADVFFDEIYSNYEISRVWASRNINSNSDKRGKLTEILVRNYVDTKESRQEIISHELATCLVHENTSKYGKSL